jgi:hypothetical protein
MIFAALSNLLRKNSHVTELIIRVSSRTLFANLFWLVEKIWLIFFYFLFFQNVSLNPCDLRLLAAGLQKSTSISYFEVYPCCSLTEEIVRLFVKSMKRNQMLQIVIDPFVPKNVSAVISSRFLCFNLMTEFFLFSIYLEPTFSRKL